MRNVGNSGDTVEEKSEWMTRIGARTWESRESGKERAEGTIRQEGRVLKFYSARGDPRHNSEFHFDDGAGIPRNRPIVGEKCQARLVAVKHAEVARYGKKREKMVAVRSQRIAWFCRVTGIERKPHAPYLAPGSIDSEVVYELASEGVRNSYRTRTPLWDSLTPGSRHLMNGKIFLTYVGNSTQRTQGQGVLLRTLCPRIFSAGTNCCGVRGVENSNALRAFLLLLFFSFLLFVLQRCVLLWLEVGDVSFSPFLYHFFSFYFLRDYFTSQFLYHFSSFPS